MPSPNRCLPLRVDGIELATLELEPMTLGVKRTEGADFVAVPGGATSLGATSLHVTSLGATSLHVTSLDITPLEVRSLEVISLDAVSEELERTVVAWVVDDKSDSDSEKDSDSGSCSR